MAYFFKQKRCTQVFPAPYLFNNSLHLAQNGILTPNIKFNHMYLIGGVRFEFYAFNFVPTTLIKIVSGSPIQIDLNANFLLYDRVWLSTGFRSNKSINFSTGYVMKNGMKFIYSYDLDILTAANYSTGSHEFSIGYGLSFYRKDPFSKRKFVKKNGGFKRRFGRG